MSSCSFSEDELNWLVWALEYCTQITGHDHAKVYVAIMDNLKAAGGVLPPAPEFSISPAVEGAPPKPINPYARSKF